MHIACSAVAHAHAEKTPVHCANMEIAIKYCVHCANMVMTIKYCVHCANMEIIIN